MVRPKKNCWSSSIFKHFSN
uniref:Uncharacterized protein n=1 Tax=Rhizophora mucronata TaxID=61149 RepID=A0A2P2QMZ7_RHIMU